MTEMTIIRGDYWVGVYIDNKIVMEAHEVSPYEAVEAALEHNVTSIAEKNADLDWLEDVGSLPELLEDVQFEE